MDTPGRRPLGDGITLKYLTSTFLTGIFARNLILRKHTYQNVGHSVFIDVGSPPKVCPEKQNAVTLQTKHRALLLSGNKVDFNRDTDFVWLEDSIIGSRIPPDYSINLICISIPADFSQVDTSILAVEMQRN